MKNPYLTYPAKILRIQKESSDSNLYTLKFEDPKVQKAFRFNPGQFVVAGLVGFGEGPFDICSSSLETGSLEICVRQAGAVTKRIHQLKIGDRLQIRGPYGHGFPMNKLANRNLLLIGGGCGFVTMRTVILDYLKKPSAKQKLQVFFGVTSERDLLFANEFDNWRKKIDLYLIASKPSAAWPHQVGLITNLFDKVKIMEKVGVLACGPPIMYRFTLERLKKLGIPDTDIYLSFERRMDCAVGVCQHCAIGSFYVCKDGPVFSYDKIKDIPGAI
ncbi:MAG: FAD/NAD(P)-binding protein [Patescibacteria group bacterium]|nr:FAD/NAD(P)-binding protein [Patescibacteria group bacterium]